MNNIKYPNLEFLKTCVLNYNEIEYCLFYWSLINCIKNILDISNLLDNFLLSFETSYKTSQVLI